MFVQCLGRRTAGSGPADSGRDGAVVLGEVRVGDLEGHQAACSGRLDVVERRTAPGSTVAHSLLPPAACLQSRHASSPAQ